jgi:hypothetical protein
MKTTASTGQLAQFRQYLESLGGWGPAVSIGLLMLQALAVPLRDDRDGGTRARVWRVAWHARVGCRRSRGCFCLWNGALKAFSWYMKDMSRFNRVNGSIAAVVVFLVWVYTQAVILLYSALAAVNGNARGSATSDRLDQI